MSATAMHLEAAPEHRPPSISFLDPPHGEPVHQTQDPAHGQAQALLAAILARHASETRPVVQFVSLGDWRAARAVALFFAAGCAFRFGRTLLVDASIGPADELAEARSLSALCTPDCGIPGLHHAHLRVRCAAQLRKAVGGLPQSARAKPGPFRMVVVEGGRTLAESQMLAAACTAVIPVAIAGTSRLAEMREGIARLKLSGALLSGVVLLRHAAASDPPCR